MVFVGFGLSGIIDEASGTVRDTDTKRGYTSSSYIQLKNSIERELSVSAYVGNDATCAAYGEKRLNVESAGSTFNIPNAIEACACGSMSMSRVFLPFRASAEERLVAVVVFPQPPFWLVMARTFIYAPPLMIISLRYIVESNSSLNSSILFKSTPSALPKYTFLKLQFGEKAISGYS